MYYITDKTMVVLCVVGKERPEDGTVKRFRLRAVRCVRVTDEVFVSTSHDRRTLVRRAHSKLQGERRGTQRLIHHERRSVQFTRSFGLYFPADAETFRIARV